MPKKIDLADILQKNPQIDPDRLSDSIRLSEELRRHGVSGRRYELAPPFGGRRVQSAESHSDDDPRTVHLNRT